MGAGRHRHAQPDRRHLDKALGDLTEEVAVEKLFSRQGSVSPIGTPLWDVLGRVVDAHYPGASLLPRLIVGFTAELFLG